jgi:hypothetical protein
MKIQGFDEQTNSLLVSFASDATQSQNPDDYPAYAYQPVNMWPDITDPTEIKKRIAMSGIYHAEQQERHERFAANLTARQDYQNMVGQQMTYALDDLTSPPPPEPVIPEVLVQTV